MASAAIRLGRIPTRAAQRDLLTSHCQCALAMLLDRICEVLPRMIPGCGGAARIVPFIA